jgi:alpha-glucosidase (family GH31 glycosyl hydrolase)
MDLHDVRLGMRRAAATAGAACLLLGAATAPARADTLKTPGDPGVDPDPPGATQYADGAGAVTLTRPASADAPGYTLTVTKSPVQITTTRAGQTVLATTGTSATTAAARFVSGGTSYYATGVNSATWQGGVLTLDLATSDPGYDIAYKITPKADRYGVHWDVTDPRTTSSVGGDFALASAGHWYGQGIAVTEQGGPYSDQPWPLDSGHVSDHQLGPFDYFVNDPFWFTARSTGMWVNTDDVMFVDINASTNPGVGSFLVTNNTRSNDGSTPNPSQVGESRSYDAVMFVESTPKAVYDDYVGIAGTPQKSDTTPAQYKTPMWNSWGDLASSVSQDSMLNYAKTIHDANLPGHTMELDDGWALGYADHEFTATAKFPDPKAMIDQIHAMGYDFGLWDTFYSNRSGRRASALWPQLDASHYLLQAFSNPIPAGTNSSCTASWFGGSNNAQPGLTDLGNPDARAWLLNTFKGLEQKYGIDGWKFDTGVFDPRCKPYPGLTKQDYIKLGADFVDQFNMTGQGYITSAWTGIQRYGFAEDSIDKDSTNAGLAAAAHQALSISTVGYPFTEMDMIGGSDGSDPPDSPTKQVLVRWAQAEALTPLMMGSVNPTRYDKETVDDYRAAIQLHEALWPYLMDQVNRSIGTGEPIMKPIFFDYPGDQASYTIDDEWLFGDSLLAAPVLADVASRRIHLPAGYWYDVKNREVVQGPTDIAGYPVTLADVPMFIRLGTPDTGRLMSALAPGASLPTTTVGGSVPATLALSLGTAAAFDPFIPGVKHDYTTSLTADVLSTAGDATLSVSDPDPAHPGHLTNGAFVMPQPLQAQATNAQHPTGTLAPVTGAPTQLLTYAGPVSHDPVTIGFQQSIAANDALRTGTYAKTLTFTLSTTSP